MIAAIMVDRATIFTIAALSIPSVDYDEPSTGR